jgi:acetylornithine aminotransferase/acetylornithine/N-succinyldiaminopimelate aminotransferase
MKPFAPMPEGFLHVPFNDMDALERITDASTVAVMLEPIQGESGVHVATQSYLRDVQDFCKAKNLLLMLDEVQTGIGRLGTLFGFERWGVEPDIITLAKGLGGGVPIGAVLAKESAAVFEPGDHGSTFGGNPLACTAALAVLRVIEEEGLVGHSAEMGDLLASGLRELGGLKQVRGRGLMQAAVFEEPIARELQSRCLEEGVIVNAVDDHTLRLVPPLVIQPDDIEQAVAGIKKPSVVKTHVAEIKQLEEEGDAIYHDAVGELFANTPDPIEVLRWKEMYDTLERSIDSCQAVAQAIHSISLKYA